MHEKIYFCTRKFLSTSYNNINEQDTSFLDCKHKHMMKCGATPDKFRVHIPYVYPIEFRDGMGPFKLDCPIKQSNLTGWLSSDTTFGCIPSNYEITM